MTVEVGSEILLEIEKPAVGGRMLARYEGQVVLAWGAIPGERVRARVERTGKGVLFAETTEVLLASPDRRDRVADWRCGGNVLAHVAYERQRTLKAEIIRDTMGRIGRVPLAALPAVVPSVEQGYRMRARLHVRDGRLGFLREGTHQLCDAGPTAQLLPSTIDWIRSLERTLERRGLTGLVGVQIAENVPGDERACHLELASGADAVSFAVLADADGVTGLSVSWVDRARVERLVGVPVVTDRLPVGDGGAVLSLRREARAFFQGNRYLLEPLVRHVVSLVPAGPVVDLYAGVGLFGLSLAASEARAVTLVEGDPVSGADLVANAAPFTAHVRVERRSVEAFLETAGARAGVDPACTVIVDPPRTGTSKEAMAGLLRVRPRRVVYVSCDIATFARDARTLIDGGYDLEGITGFDLFPNTAHVETVAAFTRRAG